ncbi:hypothetical protein [Actinorugispora endophytica]|uniref:Tumor necrosis factor receptor superfamily protein 12A n=1 Tax=Actinorugispora endophytica TaxID=1605990 RepID=A0A4R6UZF6_9ACTN|nr:hypothetical protein [Actinorugispora endophytica]TDQ51403.1 tumor necrosis factor receptor superfamily protein 12A [Actinorugispora endophytica]
MDPQQNPPYGTGPWYGPPPGQYQPPSGPYPSGPRPLPPQYQAPGPWPPPPPPYASRRRTGLVVGFAAGGAALALLTAVVLVVALGSRPAGVSDLAALHEPIVSEFDEDPYMGIADFDGEHTVYVNLYLYEVYGSEELRDGARRTFRIVWANLPGSFDQVSVSLVGSDGSPTVELMTSAELEDAFGPRPDGLASAPVETDGRAPALNRPGECSWEHGYCDELSETLASEQTRILIRRGCPEVDLREFPERPASIHIHEEYDFHSSMTFLLNSPTSGDYLTVSVSDDSAEFAQVSCSVGGEWFDQVYSRAEYDQAV